MLNKTAFCKTKAVFFAGLLLVNLRSFYLKKTNL